MEISLILAFRERRTEYIKHLEATIKHHEEQLSGLQQSSRNAADEVLMLRYKNSLLERILMEKGINVTAELRAVSHFDPPPPPPHHRAPQPAATAPPANSAAAAAAAAAAASVAVQHALPPQPAVPPPHQQQLHQQQQRQRPAAGRSHAPLPKGALMSPAQETLPVPTSRNPSPSVIAIPTPPQSSFSLPPHTTAPLQEFQQPLPPHQQQQQQQSSGIASYYPSPYQTHMEELGKLPRVLPVRLFFFFPFFWCFLSVPLQYEGTVHPRLTRVKYRTGVRCRTG